MLLALCSLLYLTRSGAKPVENNPRTQGCVVSSPSMSSNSSHMYTDSEPCLTNQCKIDVHHHYVPSFFPEAFRNEGGDPSGFGLPDWNLQLDTQFSNDHGISTRILSLSSPGVSLFNNHSAARAMVRKVNEYGASLRVKDPSRIGFFTALPSLFDKEATLAEIRYGFDVLKADGVGLYTRHRNDRAQGYYLGHRNFTEIWDELDRRKAVVFIHPTYEPTPLTRVEPNITASTIDFPQETTRTAVDLIVTDTLKNHPNFKIILSHAGGTLPYIAGRVSTHLYHSGRITKTPEEFMEESKKFYFDTATSGNELTLSLLEKFAVDSHIVFGTDFPYGPQRAISLSVKKIETFEWKETTADKVNRDNALNLFPRLNRSPGGQLV
ncbi:hypothetical protein RvY_06621 [Ramazzottius varieornatus]|uniref:2-amino-3-carboxymuconate-6-semialdehyde decarboxylase n=1 Tax=Ramazzottius varieornatus TaxID=947166 RepID=A0A1D1V4P1_RAMVA|nr:hypothetical protein RvY_06621 [Ramazzottius varieornatus]